MCRSGVALLYKRNGSALQLDDAPDCFLLGMLAPTSVSVNTRYYYFL
jgi:hypothetical protein